MRLRGGYQRITSSGLIRLRPRSLTSTRCFREYLNQMSAMSLSDRRQPRKPQLLVVVVDALPRAQNGPMSLGMDISYLEMEFRGRTYAHNIITSYWKYVQSLHCFAFMHCLISNCTYLTVHFIYLNIEFCYFYNRCSVRCRVWPFHFITFRCSAIHSEVTNSPRGFFHIFFYNSDAVSFQFPFRFVLFRTECDFNI